MVRDARTVYGSALPRLLVIGLILLAASFYITKAYGADLPQRSLLLSDSGISSIATYKLSFNIPAPEVLGSIRLQICENDPLFSDPCTVPAGFDISSVTLANQTGETGFVILPSGTNANTIVLSRVPNLTTNGSLSYTFDGVINPSVAGSYYGRLQTFTSADASGSHTEYGGIAFNITNAFQISTVVPPYLLFCSGVSIGGFDCGNASGSYIILGNITDQSTASAESQMLMASNAANGYTIQVSGTTMTSGNNVIPAIGAPDVSRPGTSQFGLNLVANSTPTIGQDPAGPGAALPTAGYNQPDFYQFVSGDVIASVASSDDYRKLTASYIINMQKSQPIGVYVATLTYTCLANF